MNETMKIIFGLLGGLAIFIFGMNLMSECLQKAAGEKMKAILSLLTKNPVLGVAPLYSNTSKSKALGSTVRISLASTMDLSKVIVKLKPQLHTVSIDTLSGTDILVRSM